MESLSTKNDEEVRIQSITDTTLKEYLPRLCSCMIGSDTCYHSIFLKLLYLVSMWMDYLIWTVTHNVLHWSHAVDEGKLKYHDNKCHCMVRSTCTSFGIKSHKPRLQKMWKRAACKIPQPLNKNNHHTLLSVTDHQSCNQLYSVLIGIGRHPQILFLFGYICILWILRKNSDMYFLNKKV